MGFSWVTPNHEERGLRDVTIQLAGGHGVVQLVEKEPSVRIR